MKRSVVLAVLALAASVLAACGGGDEGGDGAAPSAITVYSGREEEIVGPLFEAFEEETGIDVEVRYGDSAELAATLAEEGGNSPADVFFAQDAGALGAAAAEGLLAQLPDDLLERVDERYRDPDGRWVGTSGRARVVAYNTDELSEADLPETIFGFTEPEWRGKIGLPPTNASFQAFVTAMRLSEGEERTREWLEGIKANEPRFYERNGPTLEAVASGEVLVGFVNHYYLALLKAEQPDAPAANHFLRAGDPGALVNVAGAGVVEGGREEGARRFVEFLLSEEGQAFYATAAETEFPLVAGVAGPESLPPIDEIQGPDIRLGDLGGELPRTLELLNELGYTS